MPELPEVETIRGDLEKRILSKTFAEITIADPFILRTPAQEFSRRLKGKSIRAVIRRGKALLMELSNQEYLLVQVMMTGQLVVEGKKNKHTRIHFKFTDHSSLVYNDQRRFGQLRMIKDFSESKYLTILGPEPFEQGFHAEYIFQQSRHSKRPVKNLLLDHTFVAGIGNIYACEILFRCGISPQRLAGKISLGQAKDIFKHSKEVLQEAIKNRGSSMRNYRDASGEKGRFNKLIQVYARENQPCRVCRSNIIRIIQAGRSTFYCPKCQK